VTDPQSYEAADCLKDDTPVVVRGIRPDDAAGVIEAFKSLDPQSVYTRFFTYKKGFSDAELSQITDVDFGRVVALVVTMPGEGSEKLIGGGRYFAGAEPDGSRTAELAFMTADGCHGRGIASLILRHLIRIARDRGVTRFEADVLAQNQAMLAVFRRSGLPVTERPEGNTVHVRLALDPALAPG